MGDYVGSTIGVLKEDTIGVKTIVHVAHFKKGKSSL